LPTRLNLLNSNSFLPKLRELLATAKKSFGGLEKTGYTAREIAS
jgi:hypothetical protein